MSHGDLSRQSDRDYVESFPEAWSKGLVGLPAPVFDASQTSRCPTPIRRRMGRQRDSLPNLEAADDLDIEARIVDPPMGVRGGERDLQEPVMNSLGPFVEVKDRSNDADLATTLGHETPTTGSVSISGSRTSETRG